MTNHGVLAINARSCADYGALCKELVTSLMCKEAGARIFGKEVN